jgi:hypothetical protein
MLLNVATSMGEDPNPKPGVGRMIVMVVLMARYVPQYTSSGNGGRKSERGEGEQTMAGRFLSWSTLREGLMLHSVGAGAGAGAENNVLGTVLVLLQ